MSQNLGYVLEFVGGFFGILGLGYLYNGNFKDFIIRFVGLLLLDIIILVISLVLTLLIIGILGFFLIPIVNIIAAILSTYMLVKENQGKP